MPVSSLHPLYVKRARQWEIVRDCVEGDYAIKSKGELYLPRLSGSTDEQYEAYKKRAQWNNYTSRNLSGLHGLIFRRNPVITYPTEFKEILENIDRKGTNLYQFLSNTIFDTMQTSFGGYLIDIPKADGVTTVGEAEKAGIRPYLRYYPAESIINWGYSTINGVEQLSFVVLREVVEDETSSDEFSPKLIEQYRVLDARSGYYRQRVFRKDTTIVPGRPQPKEDQYIQVDEIPVVVDGNYLTELPFVLLPSDVPEKPMFYDLAMCNIGHYQKSADYENGVHLTTIPTGWITGHDNRNEDGEEEVIRLGWDRFIILPNENSKVGNLSFSGVGLVHSEKAIEQSLSDMAVLGSRLLASEKGVSESSDSARIHRAGENATLATFAKNISEKVTKVLNIMAKWLGIDGKIEVQLCTDYDTLAFDPNALNAIANLAEAGKLPLPYVFDILLNGEYTPTGATFEEYALLLAMEKQGADPLEIVEQYRLMQQGVSIEEVKKHLEQMKHDNPVVNNKALTEGADEEAEEIEA